MNKGKREIPSTSCFALTGLAASAQPQGLLIVGKNPPQKYLLDDRGLYRAHLKMGREYAQEQTPRLRKLAIIKHRDGLLV